MGTSRLKVLVADDDATARRALRAALEARGYDCVVAEGGREAWAAYQAERPSIVLADWVMPDLDGLQLCRMIRAERRERYTYVMLVTALSGKGSYLEGMRAGADDFVTKPFDLDEMGARLQVAERILGLQHVLKQLQELLPVCSYCRRIREAQGDWLTLEEYIAKHADVKLSHSVCPSCYEAELKPQLDELDIAT